MTKFFLFYILTWVTHSPFLALLIILVFYFFLDRRYVGFFTGLSRSFRTRREISTLRREVMLNPHNAEALSDLGRDLVQMKRYQEGVEYLEKSLEKMSGIPETCFYLGVGYLKLGHLDRAEEQLRRVVQIDPRYGYGEGYLRLGDVYLTRGDWDSALLAYESFVGIHTSSSEGFFKIGEIWRRKGELSRAEENFRKALRAFRGSPPHKKRVDRSWFWRARLRLLRTTPRLPGG